MAVASMRLVPVAILGCCIGLSLARSVPTSHGLSDVSRDVTHDSVTSDGVVCDESGCNYDLQLYCLSNGVIVMGSCSLKKTLCTNGVRNDVRLASSWAVCFRASYNLHFPLDQSMVMVYTDKADEREEQNQVQQSEPDLTSIDTQDLLQGMDDDDNDDGNDNDDEDDDVIGSDDSNTNNKKESVTSTFKQQKQAENTVVDKPASLFAGLSMAALEPGEESASNPESKQKEHVAMGTEKVGLEEQLLESLGDPGHAEGKATV